MSAIKTFVLLVIVGLSSPAPNVAEAATTADSCDVVFVGKDELRDAMYAENALGYDATATTNAARYFAGVVLRLARDAYATDPNGPILGIYHDDWFDTFLEVHELDRDTAPFYLQIAYRHRQDVFVDYDQTSIIKEVKEGARPVFALAVQLSWPSAPDLEKKYSFVDTMATPTLKVTNHRVLRYKLLDFGDMISYDDVDGITGRPVGGLLGALFALIGEGSVSWSRIAISEDGVQIVRAKSQKMFLSVSATVSIQPDGTAEKGLYEERPDLTALENRLKMDKKIEYYDWEVSDRKQKACLASRSLDSTARFD